MSKLANYALLAIVALIFSACAPTQPQYVDSGEFVSFGLDNHDIDAMLKKLTNSLLNDAKIKQLNEAKVLAIGAIDDESDTLIDTELIADELVRHLNDSRIFIVVNAGRDKKVAQMIQDSRKLRDNKEYNQYTTIEQGELVAPHYALTGKITQKNRAIKGDEIVEYIFTLTLTELLRGATQWIGNAKVSKKLPKDEVAKFGVNSGGFDNSNKKLQIDYNQRFEKKYQELVQIANQNYELRMAVQKCTNDKNKVECKRVVDLFDNICNLNFGQTNIQKAGACRKLARSYLTGDDIEMRTKIDKNKARKYADRVCELDGTFCANMSLAFYHNNYTDKIVAQIYSELACELGELAGCALAFWGYAGYGKIESIKKDIKKARYYKAKVCEAGYKDYCR